MSFCLLRTASLIHERIAYTTLSPARLIHQYRKRQFEINEYVTAMKVPDKIFKKKYGFDKPRPEDQIVFVCSTGARSYKALRAALHMGYNNARMFDGSFSDLAKQITDM
ncbi:rhodanese domain-containing protein CG4456-like [Schistocerca cancellata]|uniref:rhodanese domain-containing protein CG4456-like n=1 Tax=Schistocerca cancellata TaxID=274614 RepID=UPI00211756ED|nr:rhodanese domain-containing protein CG4456-like [Schistocerca cancellata]